MTHANEKGASRTHIKLHKDNHKQRPNASNGQSLRVGIGKVTGGGLVLHESMVEDTPYPTIQVLCA